MSAGTIEARKKGLGLLSWSYTETAFLCVALETFLVQSLSNSVVQAGLKLPEIQLSLPPQCWDYRHAPPGSRTDFSQRLDTLVARLKTPLSEKKHTNVTRATYI